VTVQRDPELREAEQRWLGGGSALPVVTLLLSRDAKVQAAVVARLALARPNCPDADELEEALARVAAAPPGWGEALAGFAAAPSPEAWRELMRFAPPEYIYQRTRDAIRRLRKLGVDGDSLFRCASEYGLTPDLIELVEDGCVKVETIVERAAQSGAARTTYIGLAAEAAFLAGDMLGTVRLLRDSIAHENDWCSVIPHVFFIRERATREQTDVLDRAGIPRI
jgi:cytosine/adenosine deaminase-related metal-dependent hydrolase